MQKRNPYQDVLCLMENSVRARIDMVIVNKEGMLQTAIVCYDEGVPYMLVFQAFQSGLVTTLVGEESICDYWEASQNVWWARMLTTNDDINRYVGDPLYYVEKVDDGGYSYSCCQILKQRLNPGPAVWMAMKNANVTTINEIPMNPEGSTKEAFWMQPVNLCY